MPARISMSRPTASFGGAGVPDDESDQTPIGAALNTRKAILERLDAFGAAQAYADAGLARELAVLSDGLAAMEARIEYVIRERTMPRPPWHLRLLARWRAR